MGTPILQDRSEQSAFFAKVGASALLVDLTNILEPMRFPLRSSSDDRELRSNLTNTCWQIPARFINEAPLQMRPYELFGEHCRSRALVKVDVLMR
jgi:hypothetical protein